MTINFNTTNTNLILKPAFLLIYYPQDQLEEAFPFIQRLYEKFTAEHGYSVKGVAYYPDFPDSLMLESLIIDLKYQIDKAKLVGVDQKLTIVTDNFKGIDSNITDNNWKLSTLVNNKIVDIYQGDLVINLTKIEADRE